MKPQAPQLFGSLVSSTQPLGQLESPVLHVQAVTPPFVWHVEPVGQTLPHVLQLKLSVIVFVHTPGLFPFLPHTISPVGQLHAAGAPAHVAPLGHALPQAPQSVGLVLRLSQPSGHAVVPVGQPQTPAVHVAPGPCGHFIPHCEQFAGSVITLVQTLLQMLVMPAGHTHWPFVHVAPWGQTVPHWPQLLLSVCLLVHMPLQLSGFGAMQVPPLELDVLVLLVELLELVDVELLEELAVMPPIPLELEELAVIPPVPPPLELEADMPPMPPPLELDELVMPPMPLLEELAAMPPIPLLELGCAPVPVVCDPLLLPQPIAAPCSATADTARVSHDRRLIRILL